MTVKYRIYSGYRDIVCLLSYFVRYGEDKDERILLFTPLVGGWLWLSAESKQLPESNIHNLCIVLRDDIVDIVFRADRGCFED